MQYVKSCGFIVYKTVENTNYYLIIKSTNGDVGFPKGHVESGETELQTAIRELKEETNVDVEIIEGFRKQIEYPLPKRPDVIKQTVYFLGRAVTDDVICQEGEVINAAFVSYDDAMRTLTFEDTRRLLEDAKTYVSA